MTAGLAYPDARSQGYTVACMTTFASEADMAYYDSECEAHKALKAYAKDKHGGLMMVYFTPTVVAAL